MSVQADLPADFKVERALSAARGLVRVQPDLVAYVPSNTIAPIIEYLHDRVARVLVIAREEEAVGIAGAAALTGRLGAIVMQDNGFGNALTALATFPVAYHLPLLIVANTRGGLGEYNSMIHSFSEGVPAMLHAINVPVFTLDRTHPVSDWEHTVHEAGTHAVMTHRPVVVLMDFWGNGSGT